MDQPVTMDKKKEARKEDEKQVAAVVEETATLPSASDEEKGTERQLQNVDLSEQPDPGLVTWDGPDDPANPVNMRPALKWIISIFVSLGGFVTLMSGSMIAPALPALGRDMGMTASEAESALSIFILAFAVGPLLLAPFAEVYGRKPVWIVSGFIYSGWSVVSGFSHNKPTLVASRFLAGIGGSVDFVIALPITSDIWPPEQRGQSFALVNAIPLLAPALGPLLGGAIADTIGWRWIFWVAAIFCSALMLLALVLLPETSHAKILGAKAARLTAQTGRPHYTQFNKATHTTTLPRQLLISIARPARMLATQPILQLVSVFMAFNFGVLYYLLATFAILQADVYHESVAQTGLHYIAIAIGNLSANFLGAYAMDRLWGILKRRTHGATAPEYRVPLTFPGALFIPTGLLWYGWSANARLHWIMTDVGAAIVGFGLLLHTSAMSAYILDSFPDYTASAMGASQVLRMVCGFVFPIFAPPMQARLGWGWSNTVLALIAVVFGVVGPLVQWNFGARIRAMGKPLR
ncbi:major facilitator superfamily domain-containing protein [Chaetomium tenue]|uniref:Major facilitator superfamily domain-containing protein n=1 Tax=Chaetomium tenue TaxID=1854479 RepID=A0ACB7P2T1_9PEZI|nr:major facilitator superfamily domain-containing protein [Chaetomium globosum]